MALLVVVVLGVPKPADAGPPSVQAPTGAMSGGSFSGTYTFGTYISCSSGFSFSSSYSNSLDGTHTFGFWGAADGSLLVRIDGGGLQLITSCGDPFTGPNTNVANFTVSKNVVAPTPTPAPTAAPTPAPTPVPAAAPSGSGGSSGGGGSSGSSGSGGAGSNSNSHSAASNTTANQAAAPTGQDVAAVPPAAGENSAAPGGDSSLTTQSVVATPIASATGAENPSTFGGAATTMSHVLAWSIGGAGVLVLIGLIIAGIILRSSRLRSKLENLVRPLRIRLQPYLFRLRQRLRGHAHDHPKKRGLSHHKHSGKLLAHHHTSYPALGFLIMLSSVLAVSYAVSTQAANSQLSLTVLGPPPTVAPTIDQPIDGERFVTPSQTVRGGCPAGLMVELYRNNTFAGSTFCDNTGMYTLVITLVSGQNDLVAKDLDGLSQYGPSSATVTVYYDEPVMVATPTPAASTPTPAAGPANKPQNPTSNPAKPSANAPKTTTSTAPPFYLESATHFFEGASPEESVMWQLTIHGGTPPYNFAWEWGDGHVDYTATKEGTSASNSHHYTNSGIYRVVIRATDKNGREAVMPLVAVVSGAPITSGLTRPNEPGGTLVYVWPLLGISAILVACFWLGERHRDVISKPLQQPQLT